MLPWSDRVTHLDRLLCVVGSLTVMANVSVQAEIHASVGVKAWSFAGEKMKPNYTTERSYDGVVIGPIANVGLPNDFWISVLYMYGRKHNEWLDYTENIQDAEVIVAHSLRILDLGIGLRYWTGDSSGSKSYQEWGPIFYGGVGDRFGTSPMGWYGSVSWMMTELEDPDPETSDEHIVAEAGLTASFGSVTSSLGVRYLDKYAYENYHRRVGPAFSLVVYF